MHGQTLKTTWQPSPVAQLNMTPMTDSVSEFLACLAIMPHASHAPHAVMGCSQRVARPSHTVLLTRNLKRVCRSVIGVHFRGNCVSTQP